MGTCGIDQLVDAELAENKYFACLMSSAMSLAGDPHVIPTGDLLSLLAVQVD